MSKLLSRLILGFTALSAVFFSSPLFADTPISTPYYGSKSTLTDDGNIVRTIQWISKSSTGQYAMNSAVWYGASLTNTKTNYSSPIVSYCPSFHNRVMTHRLDSSGVFYQDNVLGYISPGLVNLSSSGVITTEKWFAKHPTFYWTNDGGHTPYEATLSSTGTSAICSTTAYIYSTWEHLMGAGVSTHSSIKSGEYNSYLNKYCVDSTFCATLTDLAVSTCTVDNISSGGTCSCKKTGGYSASASGSTALTWKYNGLDVSASITTANTTDAFSSKFKNYYIKLPSGSTFKPDIILGTIDASGIGGTRSVQAIGASTGMIYSDSRTLVSTASANEYSFYTSDGGMLSSTPIVGNITTNSATNDDNTFNSFVINSSSGGFLPIAYNRFSVYYQKGAGWSYSNLADNYTYLGDYLANTMITLPYGQKTRRVKIVPLSSTVYVSGVSPFNTPFTEDQICTVLSGTDLANELASRSSLSGSLSIASINFCGVALDVPVVGSALGAMCNFVQPYVKPLVSKFQTAADFINIMPPSTPPTTFDFFPKVSFSGATMNVTTQTGSAERYSSGSDLNELKLNTVGKSSGLTNTFLGIIAILLYLAVYVLRFGVIIGIFWLLSHVAKLFTSFAGKHNSGGNIFSLISFIAYAGVFFTALISLVGFFSILLPVLDALKNLVMFFIVFLTSVSDGAYTVFYNFFFIFFSSILLIAAVYFVHFLVERFVKLN